MKSIKVLDCSLRDGGYLNDWNFGKHTIIDTFNRLNNSGVEFIEVGFLDDRRTFDPDRTIQPTTECYDRIFENIDNKKSCVVAMIDYGTCSIDNIGECSMSFIDGIRIIFKKPNMHKAVEFARQVKEKGYLVFLQLVSITSYSDRELLDFIDCANNIQPYGVSIVDTYGLMHREKMLHYFYLLDANLIKGTIIGFHSHNNFQLAYSNTIELLKLNTSHDLLADGTVFGMGKNAGNAPLELLCMYLNENEGKDYNVSHILEIIDLTALRIHKEHPWGYSLPLFVASSNDCHPNYVTALMDKGTLSIGSINEILKGLSGDEKLNYNAELIQELYRNYQKTKLCDKNKDELYSALNNKNILLIGPGYSLLKEKEKIDDFIAEKNAVIISVNCVPEFPLDYFFVGNSKRYSLLSSSCSVKKQLKIIASSNVSSLDGEFDYILNFDRLADENKLLFDNALVMMLKVLNEANINRLFLAGFDGFSRTMANYYNDFMSFDGEPERLEQVTDLIRERIAEFRKIYPIEFVTNSYYE